MGPEALSFLTLTPQVCESLLSYTHTVQIIIVWSLQSLAVGEDTQKSGFSLHDIQQRQETKAGFDSKSSF